jgi:outer membrane lipoprotein-sorting protein
MRLRVLAVMSLLLLAGSAAAFIPPGSFILRKMQERLSTIRGISATFTGERFAEDGTARPLAGRLYVASPDRFRLDAQGWLEVWAGGSKTVRNGETDKTEAAERSHPLPSLFVHGNAASALQERGVDVHHVSLGRFREHICWVVGGKAEDTSRAQLWVDKETFFPVRLRYFEGEGEAKRAVDWLFLEYDPANVAKPFPQKIELSRDGKRIFRLVFQALSVIDVPREALFSTKTDRP